MVVQLVVVKSCCSIANTVAARKKARTARRIVFGLTMEAAMLISFEKIETEEIDARKYEEVDVNVKMCDVRYCFGESA
jgi:hypothetical protein